MVIISNPKPKDFFKNKLLSVHTQNIVILKKNNTLLLSNKVLKIYRQLFSLVIKNLIKMSKYIIHRFVDIGIHN